MAFSIAWTIVASDAPPVPGSLRCRDLVMNSSTDSDSACRARTASAARMRLPDHADRGSLSSRPHEQDQTPPHHAAHQHAWLRLREPLELVPRAAAGGLLSAHNRGTASRPRPAPRPWGSGAPCPSPRPSARSSPRHRAGCLSMLLRCVGSSSQIVAHGLVQRLALQRVRQAARLSSSYAITPIAYTSLDVSSSCDSALTPARGPCTAACRPARPARCAASWSGCPSRSRGRRRSRAPSAARQP